MYFESKELIISYFEFLREYERNDNVGHTLSVLNIAVSVVHRGYFRTFFLEHSKGTSISISCVTTCHVFQFDVNSVKILKYVA